jgi:hypothetical protein
VFGARVEEGVAGFGFSMLSSVGRAGGLRACTLDDLRLPSLGRDVGFFRIVRTPWADGSDDGWVVELLCPSLLTLGDADGGLQRASCKIFVTLCGKTLQKLVWFGSQSNVR